MIDVNTHIRIEPSQELSAIGLDGLAGQRGVVVETLVDPERKNKGYMVLFPDSYEDSYLWFVPAQSVTHADLH